MALLPLLALLAIPTQSCCLIEKIVTLTTQPARAICRMLGDVHDCRPSSDHPDRTVVKLAVKKRVQVLQDQENPKPLTIYVEDPTEVPEIGKIFLRAGFIPGLVKELNAFNPPAHTIVKNFDTDIHSSYALGMLKPRHIPFAFKDALHLKDYTFGQAITELEQKVSRTEKRIVPYINTAKSHWIKKDLTETLARIKTGINLFQTELKKEQVSLSDSILHTSINLFADEAVTIDQCRPYVQNRSKQQLISLLQDGSESTTINPLIADIKTWYNPVSARAHLSKPLYDASTSLLSTDAFFSIIDTPGDSALIAGALHTDDVSGWMLNTEEWKSQSSLNEWVSDNWLLNANIDELEAEYSKNTQPAHSSCSLL